MKDVLFYQNYTAAGDVGAIALCIICWLLLGSTYTIKQKNIVLFHIANAFVVTAAFCNIAYHVMIDRMSHNNIFLVYLFRNATYIFLILTFVVYVIYIVNFIDMEERAKRVISILNWIGVAVFIVCEISTPFSKLGFYIDEQLQIHQNYYWDVFRFFYMYYVIFISGIMVINQKKFIAKMYKCIRNVFLVSFGLMTIQSFYESTSILCITFSFPILAALFLFHYNAYDAETGTLDFKAFDSYIKDLKNQKFSMICLYLKDIKPGKMHDLAVEFYHFNEKHFKNPCTFQLGDNKMAMIYENEKNSNAKQQIPALLKDFEVLYERFQIDYRIVIMYSDASLHTGEEYLALNEFVEEKMPLNSVYYCKEKDIAAFGKVTYIQSELQDISEKENLADERVLVYCQPVFNARTNEFTTAEVLMRLKFPEIGIVFPEQVIPIAERYEYIHSLSKIILDKACKEIKRLEKKGCNLERVSINFSVQELKNKNFRKDIIDIIQRNQVEYSKIAIELTETKNEKDFENMKKVINELYNLGIKFYLDDFGTEYSNLERIIGLPIDTIKFNRSLTVLARKNSESRDLVGDLCDIFKKANYQVLFEGVEDEEDEQICREMNVVFLQGFHYARPIPMERLAEFLPHK